jgi:hypothetical protein
MPDKTYPRPPILPYHPPRPIPRKGREPVAPFVGIACERPTFGKPDIGGAAPARVAEAQPRSRAAPGLRPGLLRTPARSLLTVREVPDESAARRRNENAADGAPEGARVARSSLRSSRQQRARRCGTLKDRCALRRSVPPFHSWKGRKLREAERSLGRTRRRHNNTGDHARLTFIVPAKAGSQIS